MHIDGITLRRKGKIVKTTMEYLKRLEKMVEFE